MVLIFPSSLLILLTTLVSWSWLLTTISRRLYSMKTLEITSFPLSKFHILLYGTNNFLSANQFKTSWEVSTFQTQLLLTRNPSAIHNLGHNEFFGAISWLYHMGLKNYRNYSMITYLKFLLIHIYNYAIYLQANYLTFMPKSIQS